ncbi:MAG TPA: Gfo/Idh/MocA family oxidoreductase [Bryobacteraceae bacterium]|nr:Gfo/Idh/MocA family oxidoreductase [Bryobacteraceae bacterium]
MRVALIGYGAVAAVHAGCLKGHTELATVCGPDRRKAEAFAELHGIRHADTNLKEALGRADTAIVCSPSPLHYEQAREALHAGVHLLIELPACTSNAEAEDLAMLAGKRRLVLQCAHTSRYLEAYRLFSGWMQAGALGDIRHLHYVRSIPPRKRSWTDDALWHHAAHALDLFLLWFGSLEPLSCAAHPGVPGAQDLSLTALTPGKAPVAVSISYTSQLPETEMTVIGANHTVVTDGFTYISSDDAQFTWQGCEQEVYESAIQAQDTEFYEACRGGQTGVPWNQTIRLTNCVSDFINLWMAIAPIAFPQEI